MALNEGSRAQPLSNGSLTGRNLHSSQFLHIQLASAFDIAMAFDKMDAATLLLEDAGGIVSTCSCDHEHNFVCSFDI